MLEKTLESPLDCKEIQPVHPKGNQSWVFIGRTDVEPETPILWPPDAKSWLIWRDPDAGKAWRREEKGMTENETVGWHHRLNGHGFEQAPGDGEVQGSLVCCSLWGCKELDTTEELTTTGRQKCECMWWLLWRAKVILSIPSCWLGRPYKGSDPRGNYICTVHSGHSAMYIWILICMPLNRWPAPMSLHHPIHKWGQ